MGKTPTFAIHMTFGLVIEFVDHAIVYIRALGHWVQKVFVNKMG